MERPSYDFAYVGKSGAAVLALAGLLGACRDGGGPLPDAGVDARRDRPGLGPEAMTAGGSGGGAGGEGGTTGGGGTVAPAPPDAGNPPPTSTTSDAASPSPMSPAPSAMPDAAAPPPMPPPSMPDAAPPTPPTPAGPHAMPMHSPRSVALYDESRIVDFHIDFPPGEFEKLKAPPGPDDLRWVNCSFRFETDIAPAAHCRRKGDPVDWPLEIKPQIIVRFNFIDKQGRFRGLRRINLESFDGAEAPVRDRLGMWMMREAGINAPRVNHARVFKDGQYYGLYMNIEAVDKELLEDHFGPDSAGNLWESADELKTNEEVNDNSRLWALEGLVEREPLAGDHARFYSLLDAAMDIDQVLREMATETVMLSDDNFSNGSSNFYYYDHPKRGFMVLPWDLDTILTGGPANADPFEFWGTSPPNKLRQLMNQNPAWRARFVANVVEIRDQVLNRATAKLDAICTQIRSAVRTDPTRTATFEDFEADCARVRARISERAAALRQALGR